MWLLIVLGLAGAEPEKCNSTEFGSEGDYYAGGRARHLNRPVNPGTDIGIAHKTLPLGSLVLLHVPKHDTWLVAVVIDRGPYGRTLPKGSECPEDGRLLSDGRCWYNGAADWRRCKRNKKCYPPGTRFRGCADLTPRATSLLNHDGWEWIHVYPLKGTFISRAALLQAWGGNV